MSKRKLSKPLKIVIIVGIALLPSILILSLNLFAWSAIFVGGMNSPNPPKPEITYAEFPFEVVYEIDGETITINDVYVCEFDGFGWNEGVGKHRKWRGYIKSSGEEELLLLKDGDLKFAISVGSPEYYMSDPDCAYSENTPSIYYIKREFGGIAYGVLGIEPMLEQYKLKLVSWEFSKPIKNSFE